MKIGFKLNGKDVQVDVPARTTLADCLRHELKATGTHVACEHGVCGVCTVIVNGEPMRSCLMLAAQADQAEVITVEGLTPDTGFSALQESFHKHHALQCGFCTPGFVTTAHALLTAEPDVSKERIREVLSGNLCRCTGYIGIVDAVYEARGAYEIKRKRNEEVGQKQEVGV